MFISRFIQANLFQEVCRGECCKHDFRASRFQSFLGGTPLQTRASGARFHPPPPLPHLEIRSAVHEYANEYMIDHVFELRRKI